MKMWMLNTICMVALTGMTALAETPVASHGESAVISAAKSIVAPPVNPAENKPARIVDANDACNLGRPSDNAAIDKAFGRVLR